MKITVLPKSRKVLFASSSKNDLPKGWETIYEQEDWTEGRGGFRSTLVSSYFGVVDRWIEAYKLFNFLPSIGEMSIEVQEGFYVIPTLVQGNYKPEFNPEINYFIEWSRTYEHLRTKSTDGEWFYQNRPWTKKALQELIEKTWMFWGERPIITVRPEELSEDVLDVPKEENHGQKNNTLLDVALEESLKGRRMLCEDTLIDYSWFR